MAHYAYKEFCYDIDYESFKKYTKEFEKLYGRESDGDSNYDGDNWLVAALWLTDVIEENKNLKKQLKQKRLKGN